MNLFKIGSFTSASGVVLPWKIECDSLSRGEWRALARMASEFLPPFRIAYGVPTGGQPFAQALNQFATNKSEDPILLADDVWTTGKSVTEYAATLNLGLSDWNAVVAFARGPIHEGWERSKVFAVFTHHAALQPHWSPT